MSNKNNKGSNTGRRSSSNLLKGSVGRKILNAASRIDNRRNSMFVAKKNKYRNRKNSKSGKSSHNCSSSNIPQAIHEQK